MVQDQLVDYISSQLKLGVSREAIKSALVSAGWVGGDVEDTLRKVEGGAGPQPVAMSQPVATKAVASGGGAIMGGARPAGGGFISSNPAQSQPKSDPQMIKVSDLVSASPTMSSSAAMGGRAGVSKVEANQFGGKITGNSFEASPAAAGATKGGKGGLIWGIVSVILILGLGAAAYDFYSNSSGSSSQTASLQAQVSSLNTQISSLQSALSASTTALMTQITNLTTANGDLALNLSFYAAPPTSSSSPLMVATSAPLSVTISAAWLTALKTTYYLTTPHGARITIANSAVASMAAQLKPLVGDTVAVSGTYVPGSDQITVTTVTNLSPAAPAAAPATASTTPAAAPAMASSTAPSTGATSSSAPTPTTPPVQ